MSRRFLFIFLVIVMLSAAVTAFADEELYWSNFNNDPVKSGPKYYGTFPIPQDHEPVLITRIRTFHWNNGNGAEPGQICVVENGQELQCWQAVGRSAYGSSNVYWETLTDFVMEPGHTYGFKDSDYTTWSYNEASRDRGMIELYGEFTASDSKAASPSVKGPVAAPSVSASSGYTPPANPTVGQTFLFGRYEQDNNFSNGAEPIEWQVLTVQKDRALVVSRYVLDVRAYHNAGNTWETHNDRQWLNQDFYNSAFTDAEKSQILLVTNDNPDNATYGTKGGNSTQDKIFYLSIDETRYFSSDESRKAKPSAYVKAQGIMVLEPYGGTTYWSLRSPGYMESIRAYVDGDGITYPMGLYLPDDYENPIIGARPAFWLKITPAKTCYKVTYKGSFCLAKVPTDNKCYQPGDIVTVLFEPVEYMPGLIFNGWDRTGDGTADHGYYYNTFPMPAKDVELTAICYQQIYDQQQQYHQDNTVTRPVDPGNGPYYDNYGNYGYDYGNGSYGTDFFGGVG